MGKEFGIYPADRTPKLWAGCRAIITDGRLDIPWDRWSVEFCFSDGKPAFIEWINKVALEECNKRVKKYCKKFSFTSEDGMYGCEADDKNSGGYLYCGFYTTQKYDEMIEEKFK